MSRFGPALLLCLALLALGAVRMGWLVAHQPVLGYANQFDTGRTSACLGLWPDIPAPDRYAAHRAAPFARYVEGERRPDECYISSEIAFAALAMTAWKLAAQQGLASGESMDLRFIGITKALALFVLALIFTVALSERQSWMVLHALLFAVVLCDPTVTLWMNSLYTEFGAVFFAYLS